MAGTKSSRWLRHVPGRAGCSLGVAAALLIWLAIPFAATAQDRTATSIVGDYSVVINVTDVPKDVANGPALFGRWRISFRADGTYGTVRIDVGQMVSGTYSVEGDRLTVADESGLLSCGNDSIIGSLPDAGTGTYQWTRTDDRLNLVPIEDNCAGRRILFGTRQLSGFVACETLAVPDVGNATPTAGASPAPGATPETDGSPVAEPPPATVTGAATPESGAPQTDADIAQAIDALLDQMTSCWATGQPELFLPLMTAAFRTEFLQQDGATTDPIAALAALMAATPFVWERTGDVDVIDPTHATALVRQAVNNQEDFVRYAFEFEDGTWRWAGAG